VAAHATPEPEPEPTVEVTAADDERPPADA